MKVQILDVTPDMAKMFLMKNKSNRRINKSQLEMLERSINDGHWRLTHQGIALYKDGEIADGQHRLTAIVNTGRTLRMPLFTDVERDTGTVLAIDCGLKRSVRDGAAITGESLTYTHAAIAKALEYGYRSFGRAKLTHMEQYDLVSKWRESIDKTDRFFTRRTLKIAITPVKVAALTAINNGVDELLIEEFCKTLATGEYINSIYINAVRVRNRLLTDNFRGNEGTREAYNMALNAIVRTSRGDTIVHTNCKINPLLVHAGDLKENQSKMQYATS